jgi:hypothetical protein
VLGFWATNSEICAPGTPIYKGFRYLTCAARNRTRIYLQLKTNSRVKEEIKNGKISCHDELGLGVGFSRGMVTPTWAAGPGWAGA